MRSGRNVDPHPQPAATLDQGVTRVNCRFSLGVVCLLILMGITATTAWRFRNFIRGSLIALHDFASSSGTNFGIATPVEARLVAHAGGAVHGLAYTNSRDALDEHYASGYRVFELDFNWTSDGKLVVTHDWIHTSLLFGVAPHVFTYSEFVSGSRRDGLHQMTFEDLRQWLHAHRDAFVVTDTKDDNFQFLKYLQANAGDICPQLIIQIYRLTELQAARQLRPRAVWLAVYKYSYPAWPLSRISGVDAFVIPVGEYSRYREVILAGKKRFYVHSVSANLVHDTFRLLPGIYGIYVD